jgi:HlyD family secretion protein
MDKTRLAIVDDHPAYRNSLRLILEREPDIRVVGMAEDGLAAIQMIEELHPDVMLIDTQLPRMDGIEATRIITSKYPRTTVIAMTLFTDDGTRVAALEAGACNYWSKESHFQGLRATIGSCLSLQARQSKHG